MEKHEEKTIYEFFRPKTRGELLSALKNGIKCEVVESENEITTICLNGWLRFEDFKLYKSPNFGWTIYEPIKREQ